MFFRAGFPPPPPAFRSTFTPSPSARAGSPDPAGILIGLLPAPAFLLVDTALYTSPSHVAVGASPAGPGILAIDHAAKHHPGAMNWWQAVAAAIAPGAFPASRLSGARCRGVAPVWQRAAGSTSRGARFAMALAAGPVVPAGTRIAG